MIRTINLVVLVAFVSGCEPSPSASDSAAAKRATIRSAQQLIAKWSDMGMMLPNQEHVQFFADNFETAGKPLIKALSARDGSVRRCAAYVIDEIGKPASAAGPNLLARLEVETDVLVRIYLIDAINSIGFRGRRTIAVLKRRFDSLDAKNVPPSFTGTYAEVDEKIKVGAALYNLSDDAEKEPYYTFVTAWLKPIPKEVTGPLREGYWERRWIAVNALEKMPGAGEAIELLESLRSEAYTKSWVDVHVPRVVAALRG